MPIVDLNNAEDVARYEKFVEDAPYTSVTQSVAWSKVKNNWSPLYAYLEKDGEITAGMSILTVTDKAGNTFAYCSKGPVCDPTDIDTIDALVQEALPELKKRNAFLLRMDPELDYTDELNAAFQAHGYVTRNRKFHGNHDTIQPRFNIVLDIKDKDIDGVMATMTGKTRTKIRHAMRSGVEVEVGDGEKLMPEFFEAYKTMSEIHGITYRPLAYFDRMSEAFAGKDQMKVFIARVDGQLQASAIAFAFGDKVWHMYGGSMRIKNSLMIPYLLQYEMINWACQEGKAKYDMGGVWGLDNDDGLYRFKHPFAPDTPVHEYIGELDYVMDQAAYNEFTKE
ncbi:lipid II:glycine glycyltransferase FemX [Lacticaseibacillus camelliae]|uniref:Methicillin resistance protein n=1 Tax=Lacticaseibacillus camelliae DSM 22697 = JCM 13995 TaxID=1423730 RepID=A0A0R2FA37_9LACO|nr:peptidoglycan bridge formation glycyltransferase FemA/FemB family protein [Lacticaseibacillus camelliae]KRN22012.1 hypothetical protein FC75_GL001969 [Lacticaseibacillus camelliae DSM 22697 = JCM 13995]